MVSSFNRFGSLFMKSPVKANTLSALMLVGGSVSIVWYNCSSLGVFNPVFSNNVNSIVKECCTYSFSADTLLGLVAKLYFCK